MHLVGCTKAASPRVFAPSEHPGVMRNRGTGWAGNCRLLGPVIHIAGRWSTPHHFSLSGAGFRHTNQYIQWGLRKSENWLHLVRVPGTGPQAEHWSLSRTAPGCECAEACVCPIRAVSRCMAALCASRGSGGGRTDDNTRYRLWAERWVRWAHLTTAGVSRGGGQDADSCRCRRVGAPVCIKGPRSTDNRGRNIARHGTVVFPGCVSKGPAGIRHLD